MRYRGLRAFACSSPWRAAFDHFGRYWAVFRYPIPFQTGAKIYQLLRNEKLQVHKIKNLSSSKNGIHLQTWHTDKIMTVPTIIDASGWSNDINASSSSLDQSLLANGIISPHELGGIILAADG